MSGYDETLAQRGVSDSATPFVARPFDARECCMKVQRVFRGEAGGQGRS